MDPKLKKFILSYKGAIPFKNKEKKFHEKWYKGRDLFNIPHPFRMIISAKPNMGKTTTILSIIAKTQAQDPFKKFYLVHGKADNIEYNICGEKLNLEPVRLSSLPDMKPFKGNKEKTLFVLDDFITKNSLKKEQLQRLSDLMSNLSTHDNISVILTTQYLMNIPACIRHLWNVFITGKPDTKRKITETAEYMEMDNESLVAIMKKHFHKNWSTLWFDMTRGVNDPLRYRIDGYI